MNVVGNSHHKLFCVAAVFLFLMALPQYLVAETVDLLFQVRVPEAKSGLDIFLAGDFQGWNPGHQDFRLNDLGKGFYEIKFSTEKGRTLQFKFTQGHWQTVEKGPAGEEIPNRSLLIDQAGTHEFIVEAWADGQPAPARASTLSGDVRSVEIPNFLDGRPVLVYLPPDYQNQPDLFYPVLYMFDGQNVFDASTSFVGEWEVDESCEHLLAQSRLRPTIVVAIANGGADRVSEYTPWPDQQYNWDANGGGPEHLQAIVEEIIPFINENFRTLTGPQNTGLAGSSLGGLMTIYAAGKHQDTFGLFAALSPSLWWKDHKAIAYSNQVLEPGIRLYLDMGGLEGGAVEDQNNNGVDDSLDDLRHLKMVLENRGFVEGVDLMVVEEINGQHSEAFWARRFPAALEFLFPPE